MEKKKITLFFLGKKGAGTAYSFQMAEALSHRVKLQLFISSYAENIQIWRDRFESNNNIQLNIVKTYRNNLEFLLSFFYVYRFIKIKKLVNSFSPDTIYSTFFPLWAPLLFRLLNKYRIITTIHDVIPHTGDGKFLIKRIMDCSINLSDDIVILNSRDVDFIKKEYKKPEKNICVIKHAAFSYYLNPFSIHQENKVLKNTILFLGRIEKYKGLDLLLDAILENEYQLKNVKLIIAGSGDISAFKEKLEKLGKRIELVNRWIKDDEVEFFINKCDFLVLPYKEASQSGIIPLAFSFGKTVVSTNVGALSEQVPIGTGVLVNPNAKEIFESIYKLYSNPKLIYDFGANAKDFAVKHLSWEDSASFLLDHIYNNKH